MEPASHHSIDDRFASFLLPSDDGEAAELANQKLFSAHDAAMAAQTIQAVRETAKLKPFLYKRLDLPKGLYLLEVRKRDAFYKDLAVYVIVLFVLLAATWELPVHLPNTQTAAISDLFFDEVRPV